MESITTNEDIVKDAIKRLKTTTLEISKVGGEMYPIFGIDNPTAAVYDAIPILEGAIVYLEAITHSEYLTNAE